MRQICGQSWLPVSSHVPSLVVFMFNFHMTFHFRLLISYFLVVYGVACTVGFIPWCRSGSRTHSSGLVPKAVLMYLRSTKVFFEEFVTNIRNGMFVQTLYKSWARSILCVRFAICVVFMVIRSNFDSMTDYQEFLIGGFCHQLRSSSRCLFFLLIRRSSMQQ